MGYLHRGGKLPSSSLFIRLLAGPTPTVTLKHSDEYDEEIAAHCLLYCLLPADA